MKTLIAMVVGSASLFASGISSAQNGTMMNGGVGGAGWMGGNGWMGGYGGIWPILLVIAVVGLVVWVVKRNGK